MYQYPAFVWIQIRSTLMNKKSAIQTMLLQKKWLKQSACTKGTRAYFFLCQVCVTFSNIVDCHS